MRARSLESPKAEGGRFEGRETWGQTITSMQSWDLRPNFHLSNDFSEPIVNFDKRQGSSCGYQGTNGLIARAAKFTRREEWKVEEISETIS